MAEAEEAKAKRNSLFHCDSNHLNPSNELKKKLGGAIRIDDLKDEINSVAEQYAMAYGQQAGSAVKRALNGKAKRVGKRATNQLISAKPTWPRVTGIINDLKIEVLLENELYGRDGAHVIAPNMEYDGEMADMIFLVEIGDINSLVALSQRNPLHVDTLLIVSDYIKMSNAGDASELVERAIHIIEKALFSHSLDLIGGNLRLPYSAFGNRKAHLALMRHIQFLTKRACYRTALEVSKILWSLDPFTDALGSRMITDFLAINSAQYEWFDAINEEIQCECPWMANWCYSAALKRFILDKNDGALGANEILLAAIKGHPFMIPQLAKAIGLNLDEDKWNAKFAMPILELDQIHVGAVRESMAKLYAARSGPLWKSPVYSDWLNRNIRKALNTIWSVDDDFLDYRPSVMETLPVFRHAIASDLDNVTVALPSSVATGPSHPYDPLPPEFALEGSPANWKTRCSIS